MLTSLFPYGTPHSFIFKNYSFNKYLSDCYFLEPILDARTVRSNKIDKNPCPRGVWSQTGEKVSDVTEKK